MEQGRQLLILGCSQTKLKADAPLPAIERYDGSPYRVLRAFLRENRWPSSLSVGILSAKYGLIGALTPISDYDQRMSPLRASLLAVGATDILSRWATEHSDVHLALGRDYLSVLKLESLCASGVQTTVFDGPIGIKLQKISRLLCSLRARPRARIEQPRGRPTYFLPDWDDLLDPDFDFANDTFSAPRKSERNDIHCCDIMRPQRICDGVLVSLAQHVGTKGPLKRFDPTDATSLSPVQLRARFGLEDDQSLFGDCGAFSYVNDDEPALTPQQAVTLYELYGFDYGASVDHIPTQFITVSGEKVPLSKAKRAYRVRITKQNAQGFLDAWRHRRATFAPVGVIQGLSPRSYGRQVLEYVEMGYRHIAIGGLVPLRDAEVFAVAQAVNKSLRTLKNRPWLHLFGIYRPKLQSAFRELGIDSFDSATYFRKAWLRSDQNYLSVDGQWYAAIRVPLTRDGRTRNKLEAEGLDIGELEELERTALGALHDYDVGKRGLDSTLKMVVAYESKLTRSDTTEQNLIHAYRRTLRDRPWKRCGCPVCLAIGIDVVIFRGYNRNKRRGAHNTLLLYRNLTSRVTSKTQNDRDNA